MENIDYDLEEILAEDIFKLMIELGVELKTISKDEVICLILNILVNSKIYKGKIMEFSEVVLSIDKQNITKRYSIYIQDLKENIILAIEHEEKKVIGKLLSIPGVIEMLQPYLKDYQFAIEEN